MELFIYLFVCLFGKKTKTNRSGPTVRPEIPILLKTQSNPIKHNNFFFFKG